MAKAKFDRTEVVQAATELFWRQGYNAASMQEVFKATGLQPGSLYNAFGNKEGLYEESVRYYGGKRVEWIKQTMAESTSELDGICLVMKQMIDDAGDELFVGCFLIKSQLELSSIGNRRLSSVVAEQLANIQNTFCQGLKSHFDHALAVERSLALMLACFSLRVVGYSSQPREVLERVTKANLSWLPWHKVEEPVLAH
ncbi:TetR/AcrR family transcriptional regulator [Halioxenophilus sp. WMMB6]|uniref:TetR/AcrR family transcriptional regulator n=1 Tax=Halioxenophilus sp. WMMB6 TaxID=3073815 RepID=UPI00295F5324|nr:TetR/AcrR family transcriptional regulator [Halioxenophilus sp. WMMB6]